MIAQKIGLDQLTAISGTLRAWIGEYRVVRATRRHMLVLIDNYDSFTYNLVQKLGEVDPQREIRVFRNDKVTVDEIEALKPTHIVISPGPCTPREGGISNDIIRHFGPKLPVLGVCLGHQCIGFVSGAIVERAERLMHGKTDQIHHDGKTIYARNAQSLHGHPLPQPDHPQRHPAAGI